MRTKTINIDGETIKLHLCSPQGYINAYEEYNIRTWYDEISRPRGFSINYRNTAGRIYVDENAWGLERLIAHEIGHLLGYNHNVLVPSTMHFSGLFRWFDPHNLLNHVPKGVEDSGENGGA